MRASPRHPEAGRLASRGGTRLLGALAAASGAALLALNLVGVLLPAPRASSPRGVAGYHSRTIGVGDARREFAELRRRPNPGLAEARRLHELVSGSMVHGAYMLRPRDNWWLWLQGQWNRDRRDSQDARVLWRSGRGVCNQVALVYAVAARELGLESRLWWLHGHVVAEVRAPGGDWRAADADMDVFWDRDVAGVAAAGRAAVAETFLRLGHEAALAEAMAEAYVSTDDNVLTDVPALPDRARYERWSRVPQWAVPLLLLALAALASRRASATLRSG